MTTRHDGRGPDELRPVTVQRGFIATSQGSALYRAGKTVVLVTANLVEDVPPFLVGKGTGWLTAEYAMLPGSTSTRKRRGNDGRSTEIQRLIGRSLRAAVNLAMLGPRTLHLDADVLQADGGTRTAAITAAYLAAYDALDSFTPRDEKALPGINPREALSGQIAAVSVGIVDGVALLDLDYPEDSRAEVDFNVVKLAGGDFIEIQGTGEGGTFSRTQLEALLDLANSGIDRLLEIQSQALINP